MRWTELSFYSASAWNVAWRILSHHLSQSDQNQAEPGRSCDERTSCCSGYSRGCCCHPPWAACPCGPSYCVAAGLEGASYIDPCSGQSPALVLIHESCWESWDYTWRGSLEEVRRGAGHVAKTHHCRETGLMGLGLWRAGWVRSRSSTALGVAACPLTLELPDLLLPWHPGPQVNAGIFSMKLSDSVPRVLGRAQRVQGLWKSAFPVKPPFLFLLSYFLL